MPEIKSDYDINGLGMSTIVELVRKNLKGINGNIANIIDNSDDENILIESVIPSIWGWGGMEISVSLKRVTETLINVEVVGYIAQLATSPLRKKMDEFNSLLSGDLMSKYGKSTSFLNKNKKTITKDDMIVFSIVVIPLVLIISISRIQSGVIQSILTLFLVFLGYFIVRHLLYRKKNKKSD